MSNLWPSGWGLNQSGHLFKAGRLISNLWSSGWGLNQNGHLFKSGHLFLKINVLLPLLSNLTLFCINSSAVSRPIHCSRYTAFT